PLTREECRERILTAATKAADEYFDKHVGAFVWFERSEYRKFNEHCRWLILYLFKGLNDRQIVEMEEASRGNRLPPRLPLSDNTICAGRKSAAALLGFDLPKRKGRPRKYETGTRK